MQNMPTPREVLDSIWESMDGDYQTRLVDERISKILRGRFVAHRFALITQLAGVYLDNTRNPIALQSGAEIQGNWNPRTFASEHIVPWLRDHMAPLGSSDDPYVSNPLRRTTISPNPEGAKKSALPYWQLLHDVLSECISDPAKIETYLTQSIAILRRMVDEQDQPLTIPDAISPQTVMSCVQDFLSVPSGGDRAIAVVTALCQVYVSEILGLKEVRRVSANASDGSSGTIGDVMCYGENGQILLAVEVKDRTLFFEDVRSALAKGNGIAEGKYLFTSPSVEPVDHGRIASEAEAEFRRGRSCHFVSPADLLASLMLVRPDALNAVFVREVEQSLRKFNTQPANRTAWREIIHDSV